ncbi:MULTISPECIES: ArgS-related anticodon-binding protein NrtL [Streptomyces]|uniref:DALR anticodon-binding domain-containing protein n=2 Tax=Streptomyces TaxID=1883 RepID=A0ABU4K5W8_9ACTN|nr:DALR anticodon-binding domain-containing protein [Streptomyces roseolus]MDX2293151.1 DALR anticodon-binding domain-containing protein [Streptomyces roseolus]
MTPADLSLTVQHAVRRAVDDGALRVDVPSRVKVEKARPGGVGEYASSVALTLARPAGRPALDIASLLKERLDGAAGILAVDITGPGFLNFTLRPQDGAALVRAVRAAGLSYGQGDALAGQAVRFEPPAEARAAVVADCLTGLLRGQGADARVEAGGERPYVHPGTYDVDALGTDAARWRLLRAAPHDRPLDGPPLLVRHERNALFRVQYAHSRTRRLLANGARLGVLPGYETEVDDPLPALLRDHPGVLLAAARHRAPDRVARHLEAVADALLGFQHTVLPLGDEKPSAAHRSRLALAEAAGTVLAGGLSVLGISAPDRI